jgi:uncharacterized delta-60 repeat protein
MKRFLLFFNFYFILTSFTFLNAQWAKVYGGSAIDRAFSIIQTNDGGFVVAGFTESFQAKERDFWVFRLDSEGNIQWQRTYGGWGNDHAHNIQETDDGGYIVIGCTDSYGAGYNDVWVLKLAANGDVEWQRAYGGNSYDYGYFIRQISDGGFIVAGETFVSTADQYSDGWVLKLGSNGDIEWQRAYGGLWNDFIRNVLPTADGGYIALGQTNAWSYGSDNYDIWVLKLTSTGDIEWQRRYGGSGYENPWMIQCTSDNGYMVAGYTNSFGAGGYDAWIIKLDSSGDIEWHNAYGGWDGDFAHSIQETAEGDYIVSGCTFSFGNGRREAWIMKLNKDGDLNGAGPYVEWQRTYGGVANDCAHIIHETNDGGYIVAGFTESFGAGDFDVFVLKLEANGDISPSCELVGSTDCAISYESILPVETQVSPQNTNKFPTTTLVTPQNTDAIVEMICSSQEYTLTISTETGGTTDPIPDTYTHFGGARVTVTAVPDSGYAFKEWSGDASGVENPVTIVMDRDKSLTANFVREYSLTITAGEGGTTSPLPGSHGYGEGATAVITAVPNSDYGFIGWAGDVPSGHENDNPVTIIIDSDKSITAHFIRTFQLIIAAGKGGTTDPEAGTHVYDSGTRVTITAIPNENFEFKGWSIDASSTENPLIVTMDKDKYIVASFSKIGEADKSFWELDCFIATAAYGSPLHPYVKILREFRDKYLMTSRIGQKLVSFYYKLSPFMAEVIAKHRILKGVVCYCLLPFVVFSYSMLCAGPGLTIVLFSIMLFLPVFFMVNDLRKNRYHKIEPKNHRSL